MLADKIGITTIHYEHSEICSFVLEGKDEHFYYVKPSELDVERIGGKHGTIVKLYLKEKFADKINCKHIKKLPLILGDTNSKMAHKATDQATLFHN